MLGADMAVDEASDCIVYDDAAASEAEVEDVDTTLLDANAVAADARTPMDDILAPPAHLLDDENSGLGSTTLLPEEEELSAWPFRAAAPATSFRRFFRGSRPRRQGLR